MRRRVLNHPLFVRRLNQQASLLDSGAPDALSQRLASLKTELTALLSAKTPAAQKELKLLEGAIAVKDVHARLRQVEEIHESLPTVVARLKTLDSLHRSSAQASVRLQSLEAQTGRMSGLLSSNETVLVALKEVSNHYHFC